MGNNFEKDLAAGIIGKFNHDEVMLKLIEWGPVVPNYPFQFALCYGKRFANAYLIEMLHLLPDMTIEQFIEHVFKPAYKKLKNEITLAYERNKNVG